MFSCGGMAGALRIMLCLTLLTYAESQDKCNIPNSGVYDLSGNALCRQETVTVNSSGLEVYGASKESQSKIVAKQGQTRVQHFIVEGGTTLTLKYLILANAMGDNGGSIYVSDSTLNVIGSLFTDNLANENGGAIYAIGSATLDFNGTKFTNNIATLMGSPIYAADTTKLVIVNGTITKSNEASSYGSKDGGVGYLDAGVGWEVTGVNIEP